MNHLLHLFNLLRNQGRKDARVVNNGILPILLILTSKKAKKTCQKATSVDSMEKSLHPKDPQILNIQSAKISKLGKRKPSSVNKKN